MDQKMKRKLDFDIISDKEMKNTFNYVVDYIIAKRVGISGKVEYLVKWEGWDNRSSTWETIDMFASPQITDIFESGLKEQLGIKELSDDQKADQSVVNNKKSKNGVKQRKNKYFATNFFENLRKKSTKSGRKQKVVPNSLERHRLFDVDISSLNAIKTYEKLMGASKRKSRMSCPSTPTLKSRGSGHKKETQKALSERQQRYKMREQLKTNPFNESSLSIESNESLEENKNPMNRQTRGQTINLTVSHKKNKNESTNSCNKKHKMKVKDNNNKSVKRLTTSVVVAEPNPPPTLTNCQKESPTKMFLNKVKNRLKNTPEIYEHFLTQIIEFKKSKLELSQVLDHKEELIQDLFDILMINREEVFQKQNCYPIRTEVEINEEIIKWNEKLNLYLDEEQKKKFWTFLENKSFEAVVSASSDFLWLKINKLFSSHEDLSEEFKKFMPNLCSKLYYLSMN